MTGERPLRDPQGDSISRWKGPDAGCHHGDTGPVARGVAARRRGPPGLPLGSARIGKSSLVRSFAESLGLECVTLLGTQLAPEDLIGVPQIVDGRSRFAPPLSIARDEPYCLFLDELNASTAEVQKAFYSLILDRRIGEYELPLGSVVIGAGNRATDNALARPMASALVNRLVHLHLRASADDWLRWAGGAPSSCGWVSPRSRW